VHPNSDSKADLSVESALEFEAGIPSAPQNMPGNLIAYDHNRFTLATPCRRLNKVEAKRELRDKSQSATGSVGC
jgi:hypothetical protein